MIPRGELEDLIEKRLAIHGPETLNRIRDEARGLAASLDLQQEFEQLDRAIGMLLGTRPAKAVGLRAAARASGRPYDGDRVDLFDRALKAVGENPIPVPRPNPRANLQYAAFIESYFSNYIEGTEFELSEARDIVLTGRPMIHREDDSHDIIGTYDAIVASASSPGFPESFADFEARLRTWNKMVLFSRASKNPGVYKQHPNRAGSTVFVDPARTQGTLEKGFERIMAADPGSARAAMAMLVITEIHPFTDGNGRTARLAMNEALSAAGLSRIVIPTVFRDDYILALKAFSNGGELVPYQRMLARAASFSRWLDFETEADVVSKLKSSNAMLDPTEGKLLFDPGLVPENESCSADPPPTVPRY